MEFKKVNLSSIPSTQRASNYSPLHDAISAMPFYTGDTSLEEGITVTCGTEKEENNARNSVRGYAKSHKAEFTLKTEKLKGDGGVEVFGFLIKKFKPVPEGTESGKPKVVNQPV